MLKLELKPLENEDINSYSERLINFWEEQAINTNEEIIIYGTYNKILLKATKDTSINKIKNDFKCACESKYTCFDCENKFNIEQVFEIIDEKEKTCICKNCNSLAEYIRS